MLCGIRSGIRRADDEMLVTWMENTKVKSHMRVSGQHILESLHFI